MNYAFQLYSGRKFPPWEDILERLAHLGYRHVEGFGDVYHEPAAFRAKLDAAGIAMPIGHFDLALLEERFGTVESIADTMAIQTIVCPYLAADARPHTAAGWDTFARRLARIDARTKATGREFAWHNHDFEFTAMADGTLPMDILLTSAPTIKWEADLAWTVRAGADPLDWIERYGERIVAVHVKDIAAPGECVDEDGWADVGHGTMPWKRLIAALREKAEQPRYIVEHDNPSDAGRFAARSLEALRSMETAKT